MKISVKQEKESSGEIKAVVTVTEGREVVKTLIYPASEIQGQVDKFVLSLFRGRNNT